MKLTPESIAKLEAFLTLYEQDGDAAVKEFGLNNTKHASGIITGLRRIGLYIPRKIQRKTDRWRASNK